MARFAVQVLRKSGHQHVFELRIQFVFAATVDPHDRLECGGQLASRLRPMRPYAMAWLCHSLPVEVMKRGENRDGEPRPGL